MLTFFFLIALFLLSEPADANQPSQNIKEDSSIAKGKVFVTWLMNNHQHNLPGLEKHYRNEPSPGMMVQGAVTDYSALEVSLYPIEKIVYRRVSDSEYTHERLQSLFISSGYRYWLYEWLSVGSGIWSSYSMGDSETLGVLSEQKFSVFSNIKTSAEDQSLTGLDFSIAVIGPSLKLGQNWDFSPSLRYRYAMAITLKKDEKADHHTASIGLRFWVKS